MMSPDPPKEDHPSDSDNLAQPPPDATFIAVWDDDDDDIFGDADGPYELDIGGEDEESDFSSDEDGDNGGEQNQNQRRVHPHPPPQNVNEGEGQGSSARGHYQLLIPFPTAQSTTEQSDDPGENVDNATNSHLPSEADSSSHSTHIAEDDNIPTPSEEEEASTLANHQRDINLTEENVQIIKSVMMNFSLPSPPWASQLGDADDVLANRLSACMSEKKQNSNPDGN